MKISIDINKFIKLMYREDKSKLIYFVKQIANIIRLDHIIENNLNLGICLLIDK